ncbi:MAG TPA: NfeD family protein [Anaerolineales bacterium]
MEILIDPNVAYLLLVVGVVLAIMAVFAPGTGVLEVGALFVLFLAGWEISQLPINLWALILLIIGVIPFILAVRKSRNLIFLVIALIAFVIGSAYLFQGASWWQPGVNPILAIIASLLASGYLWIAATKVLETEKIKPRHDLAKIIGDEGEAKTDIFNEGSVQIGSELWSARSVNPIPEGNKVRVVKREGFILEVESVSPVSK